MQYMPGILPQGWPGAAAAMDPGIVSIEAICMAYRQRRAVSQQVVSRIGFLTHADYIGYGRMVWWC